MEGSFQKYQLALVAGGTSSGLAFLNARVDYRFTAIYRRNDDAMRLERFHDRHGGRAEEILEDIPASYGLCAMAIRDGSFMTPDARLDDRLTGNPMRNAMRGYAGFALIDAGGKPFGAVCHFDTEPRALSDDEFEFLCCAATYLAEHLDAEARALGPRRESYSAGGTSE